MLGNIWALYTENDEAATAANQAGLKQMAEYYRRDGKLFAVQFVGPGEKIMQILKLRYTSNRPIQETTLKAKLKFTCESCGKTVSASNNRQKVCRNCKKVAYKKTEKLKKRRQRERLKSGEEVGQNVPI